MARTWWNGVGPLPDDEREMLLRIAQQRDPSMTREKAMAKPAADA
jgi:hypothetical protein